MYIPHTVGKITTQVWEMELIVGPEASLTSDTLASYIYHKVFLRLRVVPGCDYVTSRCEETVLPVATGSSSLAISWKGEELSLHVDTTLLPLLKPAERKSTPFVEIAVLNNNPVIENCLGRCMIPLTEVLSLAKGDRRGRRDLPIYHVLTGDPVGHIVLSLGYNHLYTPARALGTGSSPVNDLLSQADESLMSGEEVDSGEDLKVVRAVRDLKRLFYSLDRDSSGAISQEELFAQAGRVVELVQLLLGQKTRELQGLEMERMVRDIFTSIDTNGDHTISWEEWCSFVDVMRLSSGNVEVLDSGLIGSYAAALTAHNKAPLIEAPIESSPHGADAAAGPVSPARASKRGRPHSPKPPPIPSPVKLSLNLGNPAGSVNSPGVTRRKVPQARTIEDVNEENNQLKRQLQQLTGDSRKAEAKWRRELDVEKTKLRQELGLLADAANERVKHMASPAGVTLGSTAAAAFKAPHEQADDEKLIDLQVLNQSLLTSKEQIRVRYQRLQAEHNSALMQLDVLKSQLYDAMIIQSKKPELVDLEVRRLEAARKTAEEAKVDESRGLMTEICVMRQDMDITKSDLVMQKEAYSRARREVEEYKGLLDVEKRRNLDLQAQAVRLQRTVNIFHEQKTLHSATLAIKSQSLEEEVKRAALKLKLQEEEDEKLNAAASKITSGVRHLIRRSRSGKLRQAVISIQSVTRTLIASRRLQQVKKVRQQAALKIQSCWRGGMARREARNQLRSIAKLQALARGIHLRSTVRLADLELAKTQRLHDALQEEQHAESESAPAITNTASDKPLDVDDGNLFMLTTTLSRHNSGDPLDLSSTVVRKNSTELFNLSSTVAHHVSPDIFNLSTTVSGLQQESIMESPTAEQSNSSGMIRKDSLFDLRETSSLAGLPGPNASDIFSLSSTITSLAAEGHNSESAVAITISLQSKRESLFTLSEAGSSDALFSPMEGDQSAGPHPGDTPAKPSSDHSLSKPPPPIASLEHPANTDGGPGPIPSQQMPDSLKPSNSAADDNLFLLTTTLPRQDSGDLSILDSTLIKKDPAALFNLSSTLPQKNEKNIFDRSATLSGLEPQDAAQHDIMTSGRSRQSSAREPSVESKEETNPALPEPSHAVVPVSEQALKADEHHHIAPMVSPLSSTNVKPMQSTKKVITNPDGKGINEPTVDGNASKPPSPSGKGGSDTHKGEVINAEGASKAEDVSPEPVEGDKMGGVSQAHLHEPQSSHTSVKIHDGDSPIESDVKAMAHDRRSEPIMLPTPDQQEAPPSHPKLLNAGGTKPSIDHQVDPVADSPAHLPSPSSSTSKELTTAHPQEGKPTIPTSLVASDDIFDVSGSTTNSPSQSPKNLDVKDSDGGMVDQVADRPTNQPNKDLLSPSTTPTFEPAAPNSAIDSSADRPASADLAAGPISAKAGTDAHESNSHSFNSKLSLPLPTPSHDEDTLSISGDNSPKSLHKSETSTTPAITKSEEPSIVTPSPPPISTPQKDDSPPKEINPELQESRKAPSQIVVPPPGSSHPNDGIVEEESGSSDNDHKQQSAQSLMDYKDHSPETDKVEALGGKEMPLSSNVMVTSPTAVSPSPSIKDGNKPAGNDLDLLANTITDSLSLSSGSDGGNNDGAEPIKSDGNSAVRHLWVGKHAEFRLEDSDGEEDWLPCEVINYIEATGNLQLIFDDLGPDQVEEVHHTSTDIRLLPS